MSGTAVALIVGAVVLVDVVIVAVVVRMWRSRLRRLRGPNPKDLYKSEMAQLRRLGGAGAAGLGVWTVGGFGSAHDDHSVIDFGGGGDYGGSGDSGGGGGCGGGGCGGSG